MSLKRWSPAKLLDPSDGIEATIAAENRKTVLPAKRCNPEIVGRNWLSGLSEFRADGSAVMRYLIH